MSLKGEPIDPKGMKSYPLPFLGEWWIPAAPWHGPDFVLRGGFDGERRYIAVRAEGRDGKPGWIVKQDPDWMNCHKCGESFDMRQLDQVVAHEHDGLHEATGIVGEAVR